MAIAMPTGIGIAVWLSEYGRPAALARVAESTIEMLAGTPSVVLALFGTLICSRPPPWDSSARPRTASCSDSVFRRCGDALAGGLPLVVATVREGLQVIPAHVREASYAVGKTKIATTRRVLLPAARPSLITGAMLGLGRVIGDTAIISCSRAGRSTSAPPARHRSWARCGEPATR